MALNKNKINDNALKYIQKGQIKKAIREYDKILAEDPSDVRTQLKKGDLLVRVGDKEQAVDTYLIVANAYSQQGFHLKAVAVFKQVLKIDEARIDVNLRLAEEYQNLGIVGDAMSHLQIVASYYDQQGMIRDSLGILRRIVDLDPDNIASRIKLAELYSREEMLQEAVEEFTQAAEALKRDNRIEDYIKVAERLIYHDPNNLPLIKELANIYLQRGDTKRALGKLQVCFKVDSRDLETLSMLAMAFQELNQLSKTVSVHKEMAKIYEEQGQVAEMQEVYRRILEIAPDDQEAKQALGYDASYAQAAMPDVVDEPSVPAATMPTAQQYSPEPVEVEEAFETSIDEQMTMEAPRPEPDYEEATQATQAQRGPAGGLSEQTREMISRLLTETDVYIKYGLHNKAYEHLNKVFAEDPNNIEAHDKLKELYVAAGQNDHACQELSTLVQLCLRVGRLEDAQTYLRALLTLDPNHPNGPSLEAMVAQQAPVGAPAGAQSVPAEDSGGPDVLIADDDGLVEVSTDDAFDEVDVTLDFDDADEFSVETEMPVDDEQFTAPAVATLDGPADVLEMDDSTATADVAALDLDNPDLSIEPDLSAEVDALPEESLDDLPGLEDVDELLGTGGGDFDGMDMGYDDDDDDEEASTRIADLSDLQAAAAAADVPDAGDDQGDGEELLDLGDYGAGEETVDVVQLEGSLEAPTLPDDDSGLILIEDADDLLDGEGVELDAFPGATEEAPGLDDLPEMDAAPGLDDMPDLDDAPAQAGDADLDDIAAPDEAADLTAEPSLDELPVLDDVPVLDEALDLEGVPSLDDMPEMEASDEVDAVPVADDAPSLDDLPPPVESADEDLLADEDALAPADDRLSSEDAGPAAAEPELIDFDGAEDDFFVDGQAAEADQVTSAPPAAEEDFEEEPATELHLPSMADGSLADLPPDGLDAGQEDDLLAEAGDAVEAAAAVEDEAAAPQAEEPAPPAAEPEVEDDSELEDGLEEVEFFIQQNLLDEARDALEMLKEDFSDRPEVQALDEKLTRLLKGEAPVSQVAPEDLGESFDLAAEIEREVGDDLASAPIDDEFQYSVDDVFSEFKKGVEKVVEKEDSATHFDLGIAYKEMGLIDDAITEFSVAAQDDSRRTQSLSMIGICHVERGQYSEAINTFKDALHGADLDEQEATGLYYEIGAVYEQLKDDNEALFYFKKVYKRDPKFRDVKARLKVLVKAMGGKKAGKDAAESSAEAAAGKKDKISYM